MPETPQVSYRGYGTKPPGNSLIGVGIMGSVNHTDCVTLLRTKEKKMTEFVCLMQDGEDELARWYFTCDASDEEHAEEQALDGYDAYVIAVYRRVK